MITKIQNTDNYSYRYANIFMGGQASLTFLCQVQSRRQNLPVRRSPKTVMSLEQQNCLLLGFDNSSQPDISDYPPVLREMKTMAERRDINYNFIVAF